MAESLNVIALISGGKDSFFSILHCIHNNHRIVALAHLFPKDSSQANSYMYQTAGHNIIPHYRQALGLPLYRQPISGSAVNTDLDYEPGISSEGCPSGEDETESLVFLLETVKADIPEANAVCSGAIGTYHRNLSCLFCTILRVADHVLWLNAYPGVGTLTRRS